MKTHHLSSTKPPGLRFVQNTYLPRIVGFGLGSICVASVFYEAETHWVIWSGLIISGFLWPHVAYRTARNSTHPAQTEMRNLLTDAFLGGFWVPLMKFNLITGVTILTMLSMNSISIGGPRFLLKGFGAHLLGAGLGVLLYGFTFNPQSSFFNVLCCIPMLIVYPQLFGGVAHRLSLRLSQQKRQFKQLSRIDGLTGLNNRVYWEKVAQKEFERSRRNGNPVSLILLDIDDFKQINDRYGHLNGDNALRKVAELLHKCLRKTDIAGRFGGDEFGVVLPDTDADGAWRVSEKLRREFEKAVILSPPDVTCTISLGVAQLEDGTTDFSQWIDKSDMALAEAKQVGRNRSVLYVKENRQPV